MSNPAQTAALRRSSRNGRRDGVSVACSALHVQEDEMSKAARMRNKAKRDSAKRQRREANKAHYAALAGTAENRKRKHRRGGAQATHVRPCGNQACSGCYPEANDPWKAPRDSYLWAKRFTSPKHRARV